jgi:SRSO17 transposase
VESCQLGVLLAYATGHGRALLDRELYLPKSWIGDAARRTGAGIGTEVEFATKPALAARVLARAFDAGVPAAWVTADEADGQDAKFRAVLDAPRVGYVLAVPRSQPVDLGGALTPWLATPRPRRANGYPPATAPKTPDSTTGRWPRFPAANQDAAGGY